MGRLRIRSLFLAVLIFDISLKSLPSESAKTRNYPQVPEKQQGGIPLFVFGDSFLDAGNNNYINISTLDQENFPPYGQTFFGFPTWRFSDGRIMSDFILYSIGGKKFGFMNLPSFGCFPGLRMNTKNGSCSKQGSNFIELHTKALSELLIKLETELEGFKYSLYDFNSMLSNRINLPSTYGFKEGKSGCCGIGKYRGEFRCGGKRIVKEFEECENPSEYVFWDSYHHPTQTLHKQLALQMWTATPNPYAYNLFQLFQFN